MSAAVVGLSCVVSFVAGLMWSAAVRQNRRRASRREKRRQFWQRQSREFLQEHGLLTGSTPIPPLLPAIDDYPAAMVALELINDLMERRALGPLLDRDQFSMAELVDMTKFTVREAEAAVEVLLAAGALVGDSDAFSMTLAAKLYLSPDSPLCACDYPTRSRTWRLPNLLRFSRRRSINAWRKGTATQPEQWAISMHRLSFPLGFALHAAGVVGETDRVLDVAAGAGSVCIALALKNEAMSFSLIELPGSVSVAQRLVAAYGLTSRIDCIGLDMFRSTWPSHHDAAIFTNIFHDWDDELCTILARKAREALAPGGRIVVVEALLNHDAPGPLRTATASYNMARGFDGRQRRAKELTQLLSRAGFSRIQVRPLWSRYTVIVASLDGGEE